LTPPECKDYKRLKAKRDKGDKMTPEELARYRELKDKIKKHKDDEAQANAAMHTPPHRENRSPINEQKSIIKTPDDNLRKPTRKVTYAPLPETMQESMILPQLQN